MAIVIAIILGVYLLVGALAERFGPTRHRDEAEPW